MNFFMLILILFFLITLLAVLKRWPLTHRQRLLSYSTPISWVKDLESYLPAYHKMQTSSQKLLIDRLKIHLAEVPCIPLADCKIETKKRLLALAPWCALTLKHPDPAKLIKRIMFLLPEEAQVFQPLVEDSELLVLWHDDQMKISIHPHYLENNLLQNYLNQIIIDHNLQESSNWQELLYTSQSQPLIEFHLGWRSKI